MSDAMLETLQEKFGLKIIDPATEYTTNPTNAVIYGFPGTRKTGLAATAPKPLIIDFENGAERTVRALNKAGLSDAKVVRIDGDGDVREQLLTIWKMLKAGGHGFQTVVLDPIGEMQAMILARTVSKFRANRIYENQPVMADYGKAFADAIKIMKAYRALPMHTVFVCHALVPKQGSDDEREDGDEIVPLVQGKQVLPFITGAMDGLFYTTVRHGEKPGERKFVVVTDSNGRVRAKNRGNLLPQEIENPNLTDIFAVMDMVPTGLTETVMPVASPEEAEAGTESEESN